MAIKDQCEKCKSYTSCSESKEFNGLSCPSYSKRIDLEKPQDNKASEKLEKNKTEVVSTNVELPDPNQSIQGWLTFFLFSIISPFLMSFFIIIICAAKNILLFI